MAAGSVMMAGMFDLPLDPSRGDRKKTTFLPKPMVGVQEISELSSADAIMSLKRALCMSRRTEHVDQASA